MGAALLVIDSRLKAMHGGKAEADPERQRIDEQFVASSDSDGAGELLDGVCTLLYMFMRWPGWTVRSTARTLSSTSFPLSWPRCG